MRVAVLGAGTVGRTLASALSAAGHDVALGSRTADNPVGQEWAQQTGGRAGTFAEVVDHVDVVVNATPGLVSAEVLHPLAEALVGVVLVDVANPLDFSDGFPPTVAHPSGRSLGEQLQATLPHTRVVKALNTVTASVMVDPGQIQGRHHLFVCGDDEDAKRTVASLLGEFGWHRDQIIDVGDIAAARATEMYLLLWVRIMGVRNTPVFNVAVVP